MKSTIISVSFPNFGFEIDNSIYKIVYHNPYQIFYSCIMLNIDLHELLGNQQHDDQAEESQGAVDWIRPRIGSESLIVTTEYKVL